MQNNVLQTEEGFSVSANIYGFYPVTNFWIILVATSSLTGRSTY